MGWQGGSGAGAGSPARAPVVAIMQPYFMPYAGYFRLFAAADLLVLYDCVQFPRRGWVHRNRLLDRQGQPHWLTLPLARAPREVLIRDLAFRGDAAADLERQFRRFPALGCPAAAPLLETMRDLSGVPLDYIGRLLRCVVGQLGLPWRVICSSSLAMDPALHGQDRILAIASRLGARCYVNPSGGRALYDARRFEEAGVALRFLPPLEGSHASILQRLATEAPSAIAAEIAATTHLLP